MTTHAWAVLHVPDVAASLAFYSDRLGWRQGERPADDVAFIHDQAGDALEQDWYDTTNASAATLDYARLAVEPALALFRAQRAYIASLVRHLSDAWDRHVQFTCAGLPEAQRLTVGFVVRIQARHALEHIADIWEIRRVHGR
jgi:catechol 2,3-dioxygenase-like lactoylglutathione lyase family enzyme